MFLVYSTLTLCTAVGRVNRSGEPTNAQRSKCALYMYIRIGETLPLCRHGEQLSMSERSPTIPRGSPSSPSSASKDSQRADSTVDSSSEVSTRPNSHMDEAKIQKVTLHSHNYPFLYKPKPSWRCKKASLASNHLTFVVGGLTVSSTPQEEENLNVLIRVRPALGDEQKQDKGGSLPRTLVAKYVLRPSLLHDRHR